MLYHLDGNMAGWDTAYLLPILQRIEMRWPCGRRHECCKRYETTADRGEGRVYVPAPLRCSQPKSYFTETLDQS